MDVKSLGYRTDLIFPKFDGQIIDRGNYLVILTLTNPTYHWGNFLLFSDPPGKGDLETWKTIFTKEIGTQLNAKHFAFGWDSPEGKLGEAGSFLEAGFDLSQSVVLTACEVRIPTKYNREVTVRPLNEDWEWEQAMQTQMACRLPELSLEDYQVFKRDQMRRFRQMTSAGLGQWFGAFLEGQLVAELGIFADGRIGRFQQVMTHPDYRRRGICGALVTQASCFALEKMNVETLVMVADEDYHAINIYKSIGFQSQEYQVGLHWNRKSL